MRRLRPLAGAIWGGVLLIVWLIFVLGAAGLFVGGLAYRKDCVNREGRIEKDWTFQWVVVLPYLLRPSEEGCVVHTGTRVALDAVGVSEIKEDTAAEIVREGTNSSRSDQGTRYYAGLFGALSDLKRRSEANAQTVTAGARSLRRARDEIAALTPPAFVQRDHGALVDYLDRILAETAKGARALRQGDSQSAVRISQRIDRLQRRFFPTGERIRREIIRRRIG